MSKKLIIAALFILVTTATVFGLWSFQPQAQKRPPAHEPMLNIEVIKLKRQNHQIELPSRGIIKAQTQSTLSAEVAGSVIAIADAFRTGGRFNKGDWLLSIDSRDYEAALKLAEANLKRANLSLEQEAALAEQASRDWQRLGNAKAAPKLVKRTPQLAAAQADLESAQAQVDIARVDLSRTKIHAPFNGQIIKQLADVGQYLNPGTQLADIQGQDILEVELPLSAQWRAVLPDTFLPKIREPKLRGSKIKVELKLTDTTIENHWTAHVVRRSAGINLETRQISLIAEVDKSSIKPETTFDLQAGDFVKAIIYGKKIQNVFVLPHQALVEGKYVWLLKQDKENHQNRIYKQAVDILWLGEQEVLIKDNIKNNLSAGDYINITPLGNAINGTLVTILSQENNVATPLSQENNVATPLSQENNVTTPGQNKSKNKNGNNTL